ncbi:MAG: toxin glutamine deamidase domain-containing protein [Muribaculum sp.]|nr:toxin glutamine deamidase domain-containing protein [Muribaculum sp.]
MRGNPNYKKAVKFRVNCQCSVLANEMRRRGFDVEAYGNTKQDWYMPSLLAKKPEIAFMNANGELPIPKAISYNGDLLSSLKGEMKEQGRYHLRFRFANDGGHIITAERLKDGSLRIYDPQSGKTIKDFSEYASSVKHDSFEYYRVDNLKINPNVAKGTVKHSKSKGDAPKMALPEIKEFLEKGWYGDENYYSPQIHTIISSLRSKAKKTGYFEKLLEDASFRVDNIDNNGSRTIIHPGHKIKDAYWEETKKMAYALNKYGKDVIFLPEHDNLSMADAIVKFKDIPRVVDFKYSASVKYNTLQQHLVEGFNQAGCVVLKLENMDAGQFRDTVEYLKRKNLPIGDIILLNQYGEVMELSSKLLRSNSYRNKIKGFLK